MWSCAPCNRRSILSFLFNTISTIVSLVRTEPDKARSLLIDFSNYYRQTLSDSDTLTTLEREAELLSIYVRAFETDDGLEIIVEDDGIGMSEEVCAHLFEQHRREEPESITADGSVKRGCGLALFNVLQRIHFFYGEDSGMRVKSQEGVGTQVIVELNGEPHEPAPLTA